MVERGTRGTTAVIGPDGCLYAAQLTAIAKIAKANGSCAIMFLSKGITPISERFPFELWQIS